MQKVTVSVDTKECKTCMIDGEETVGNILKHFQIDYRTKNVYMNGTEIPEKRINKPIEMTGNIYISVKSKTF